MLHTVLLQMMDINVEKVIQLYHYHKFVLRPKVLFYLFQKCLILTIEDNVLRGDKFNTLNVNMKYVISLNMCINSMCNQHRCHACTHILVSYM